MTEKKIDEAEARRILEDLARHGSDTAKVASLKVLREMDKDERAAAAEAELHRTGNPGFDDLYDDELTAVRARAERASRPRG
jgi:hypothetical protein